MEVDLAKQLFCNSSSLSLASELNSAFDDVLNHHTTRLKREAPAVSQSVFQVSNFGYFISLDRKKINYRSTYILKLGILF